MSFVSKPPQTAKEQPNVPSGNSTSGNGTTNQPTTTATPQSNTNNLHTAESLAPTPNLNQLYQQQVTPQQQLQVMQQAAYYLQMQQQMHGIAQSWSKESFQTLSQRFNADDKNQTVTATTQSSHTAPPSFTPQNNTTTATSAPSVTISKVPAPTVPNLTQQPMNYQPASSSSTTSSVQGNTQNHTSPPKSVELSSVSSFNSLLSLSPTGTQSTPGIQVI